MKTTNILLSLAVMGTLTLGFADATDTSAEISHKVQAIKSAPAQERSTMMNQLKADMQKMTPQQREATREEMHKVMHVDMSTIQADISAEHTQMQEHVQNMQMSHNDDMHREQNMNQHQAGHEYADKKETFFDVKH